MTGLYTRAFPLDDIRIRAGDGRTVEAYAAVFDTAAEVRDQDGHYEESIDKRAYDRTLAHLRASSRRSVQVLYHHGMTLHGTPSERGSVPIAVSEEIRPDGRGLFVIDRYLRTELADEVLENIRAGAIAGYSFTGRMIRSDPPVPRGGFRARAGKLPSVRRMEIGLREYGPTPFPIYADAGVVALRARLAGLGAADIDDDDDLSRAAMSSAEINDLPDSAFAYIEPGGTKDAEGKTVPRSLRRFPVHDEAHARNALQRAPQSPYGDKAMPQILKAARKFGIEVSDDDDRQSRATPHLGPSHLDTPYLGPVTEDPPVPKDVHSARFAIGWARTRAAIRERTGVRHAKEEEKRGPSRAA